MFHSLIYCHCHLFAPWSFPHKATMDHRRPYNPISSGNKHQLPSERENGGRHNLRDHHKYDSGPSSWQNPSSPQHLSTRKECYERNFPVYKQPVEVGSFSLDSKRRFFNDSRQMRFYTEPCRNPNFDLRDGYRDRYIKRDDSVKEKLDHMLQWILANRATVSSSQAVASPR